MNIAALGTVMGVWAHPDDETMSVGGIISMLTNNEQQVICLTATKGEAGVQDEARWPVATLAKTREEEMRRGVEILGIQHHHWLDYHDGKCADVNEQEATNKIAGYIKKYRPDTIITFAPDGITGHPDHMAVSRWARQAVSKSGHQAKVYYAVNTKEAYVSHLQSLDEQFNIYFATDNPIFIPEASCDIHVALSAETVRKKAAVIAAMPSQYSAWTEQIGEEQLGLMLASESLVAADRHQEFWPNFR